MATRTEARNACMAVARSALVAAGVTDIVYDSKGTGRRPEHGLDPAPYAFVRLRHVSSRQTTVGGGVGERRFRRRGALLVNLWARRGDGLVQADVLTEAVLASLEDSLPVASVDLFNLTANEIGEDGGWFGMLITGDVTYDDVR